MPIPKIIANRVLTSLDRSAATLEKLVGEGKIDSKLAAALVRDIDTFADRFQIAAFGQEAFERYQARMRSAKVIQKDSDEKFMDTYDNPNKVISEGTDQPYLHKSPASFNSKGIDNFDQDRTTAVTDRDEYTVRDLSEHAESTKKQPSWTRGPAGKSTKQGATAAPQPPKQWA